jgi:uncharacterized membrane protein HdeD (DUF308 family)
MSAQTASGTVGKASGWSMLWGIVMLFCGMLAIIMPLATSIAVVLLLAWLILFAAVSHLIFAFHTHGIGGVLWQILLALLYGAVGVYLLMKPLLGVVSLTLVAAVFLLCEGVIELIFYFRIRHVRRAGWVLVNGIITLILGILIWAQWPASALWVIGTLVGISLIFSGVSRLMLSATIRHLSPA